MIDSARNKTFYWSTLFFRELYTWGVRHVVISPGSRSTPLTLAAAAHPGFEKHIIIDERSAAFTALGIGKATGKPAILVCTSGTAVANYYPAVIEARESGVPLIVASADRPPMLRNTGANQSIDQLKMFGDYTVLFHEVGEAVLEEDDINRLQLLAGQAVDSAVQEQGPVHLNFPFRKPLEAEEEFVAKTEEENKKLMDGRQPKVRSIDPEPMQLPKEVITLIRNAVKPLVIAGPLPPNCDSRSIARLAEAAGAPVLAEGNVDSANSLSMYEAFLRKNGNREELKPDLILRFGCQPTAKVLEWCFKEWDDIPHLHFAATDDWHDATFSTTHRLLWKGREFSFPPDFEKAHITWLRAWQARETDFRKLKEQVFEKESRLTDGAVHHFLQQQLGGDRFVFYSNSFPVRDALLFGSHTGSKTFVNRGASGIDGITSTATGIGLASGMTGVLFTGDLAFLHDSNALLNSEQLKQPLVVVVLNNGGGTIFRTLPVSENEKHYRDYFETPQQADIGKLSAAHGLPYRLVDSIDGLKAIKLSDFTKAGLHILECKTDAEASMEIRKKLWGIN